MIIPLFTLLPLEEEGVILLPEDTTLNSSAVGFPLNIPVSVVPPLKTSIVVPEPEALDIAPLFPAGKECASFDKITVYASAPSTLFGASHIQLARNVL